MRWNLLLLVALVGLSGCEPEEVLINISGTLFECDDPDGCDEIADAPMIIRDLDGAVASDAVTDDNGNFLFEDVPGEAVVFPIAERWPDQIPTSFLAQTGTADGAVPDGALYTVALDNAQAVIDAFSAAHPEGETVQVIDPETDDDGGMARGNFLIYVENLLPEDWPGKDSISCYFEDDAGDTYPCTYYDKDGNPDWSYETTTTDGGWVAFGLPVGILTLVVLDGPADEAEQYASTFCAVEEDGMVVFDYFQSPF